jgi:hypothetical protein
MESYGESEGSREMLVTGKESAILVTSRTSIFVGLYGVVCYTLMLLMFYAMFFQKLLAQFHAKNVHE